MIAIGLGLSGCGPQSIKWEHDNLRSAIAKQEAQLKAAEEFNRTNTNPRICAYVELLNFSWTPKAGEIELGYRSDGTVVWRYLPETFK